MSCSSLVVYWLLFAVCGPLFGVYVCVCVCVCVDGCSVFVVVCCRLFVDCWSLLLFVVCCVLYVVVCLLLCGLMFVVLSVVVSVLRV